MMREVSASEWNNVRGRRVDQYKIERAGRGIAGVGKQGGARFVCLLVSLSALLCQYQYMTSAG